MKYIRLLGISLAVLGNSQFSFGGDEIGELPSWQSHEYIVTFSGNAVKKEARKKQYISETIYTNQSEKLGNISMSCIGDVFTVAVAYKAINMEDFVVNNRTSRRWRSRMVEMQVDGVRQKMNTWTYVPKLGIAIPKKNSDRAKIYNAAIRGQSISLDMDFKKSVDLILPKPDQVFNEFGEGCGMGIHRNKDH